MIEMRRNSNLTFQRPYRRRTGSPTWSKLLLINTEELIFSLTMQADTQKRSTKISNIRQLRSGNGQKNSGIRSSKQTPRIPFLVTKNVVPVMIKQGKGDIVNVSSRMGRIASQMGAYAVAKGGIVTMTKTTAIQTKEYGIKCNAVSPGIVDTPGQRVYNHSVGQDGCPMGSSKRCCKSNHRPVGRFTGSYDRTVYRPVHNSIGPNDYKRHCHHWQCLLSHFTIINNLFVFPSQFYHNCFYTINCSKKQHFKSFS